MAEDDAAALARWDEEMAYRKRALPLLLAGLKDLTARMEAGQIDQKQAAAQFEVLRALIPPTIADLPAGAAAVLARGADDRLH